MSGEVGALVQRWRKARRLSQLRVAAEAAVSIRHLCFIETGRARPSRLSVSVRPTAGQLPARIV